MDGGLLPWRVQKHDLSTFPTIESYTKCLPPPPAGYHWERVDDHSWVLIKEPTAISTDLKVPITSQEPLLINHLVFPSDTLQGICLKYRISPADLRRINCFSGNNIRSHKILKIPIEPGIPFTSQMETREYILQKFKNETNEETKEAVLYLEENAWDFDQALTAWKEDDKFSKLHQHDHDNNLRSADIDFDPGSSVAIKVSNAFIRKDPTVLPLEISIANAESQPLLQRSQDV